MDALRTYDYLLKSRALLFDAVRPLSAEQYNQQFPIGLGSLSRTLTHLMICEFAYVERMCGRDLVPYEQWPIQDENPPPFTVLEAAWRDQAKVTREAFADVRDWSQRFEYRTDPSVSSTVKRPTIISMTYGDLAMQMALHEAHHRAQALFMLRHLGVSVKETGYHALMFDRREA